MSFSRAQIMGAIALLVLILLVALARLLLYSRV